MQTLTGALNGQILVGFDADLDGEADVCYDACKMVPLEDEVAVIGDHVSWVFDVSCPAGYIAAPGSEDTATCVPFAGWVNDTVIACDKRTCAGTPAQSGVTISCDGSEYLDECTPTCADGYYLSQGWGYKCDVVSNNMEWVGHAACATQTSTTTSSSGIDTASMPSAIFSIVFVCLLQMLE